MMKRPALVLGRPSFTDPGIIGHFLWAGAVPTEGDERISSCWDAIKDWNGGRWKKMVEACGSEYGIQPPRL